MCDISNRFHRTLQAALFFLIAGALPGIASAQGVLEIYKNGPGDLPGNLMCSLALETGEYDFTDMDKCDNDEAYFFKLIDAPSATVISFHDTPDCNEKNNQEFYFYLKTVKHNLTFDKPLELDVVAATAVGSVVKESGGVRMEKKYVNGKIDGKLSCVTIKRSGVPGQ